MSIHPTAVIAPGAIIGEGCEIGPYCVIGANVKLGKGVRLLNHVVVDGYTEIGDECQIFPFASIGHAPQDKKYKGEPTKLLIGKRNVIREHVTMNPGTVQDSGITQVGDDCLFLTASHVAHDCKVGNHVIMSNNATLAGHVTVGDHVIIGGLAAVHQFVRIGANAFIGGMVGINKDVIPFGMVMGNPGDLDGLNLIGLKRRNLDREGIASLRGFYKQLFQGEGTLSERLKSLDSASLSDEAKLIVEFMSADSSRSYCMPEKNAVVEAA